MWYVPDEPSSPHRAGVSTLGSSSREARPTRAKPGAKGSRPAAPSTGGEPEILEGLARDIVSRLTATLFAEEDLPAWRCEAAPAEAVPGGSPPHDEVDKPPVASCEGVSGAQADSGRARREPTPAGGSADGDAAGASDQGPGTRLAPITELFRVPTRTPGQVRGPREGRSALLVRGTVRSGRQIRHNGDVVVLGDVNPGAQVVAAGDVVVMGTLRGMVHAGATGDHAAAVTALRLCPTQLRIASYVARPPEEPGGHPEYPEQALVRDGVVIVRPLSAGSPARSGLDGTGPGPAPGREEPLTGEQ